MNRFAPHGFTVRFLVDNVNPTVTVAAQPLGGGRFALTGTVTDPGLLDTHTSTGQFPDGPRRTNAGLNVTRSFSGAGTVTLTVEDDDGGVGVGGLATAGGIGAPAM